MAHSKLFITHAEKIVENHIKEKKYDCKMKTDYKNKTISISFYPNEVFFNEPQRSEIEKDLHYLALNVGQMYEISRYTMYIKGFN